MVGCSKESKRNRTWIGCWSYPTDCIVGINPMKLITIEYIKTDPSIVHENRLFFKNRVKKNFISYCAYKGLLNDYFSAGQITAAKKGILPSKLSIHHRQPLSGGGNSEFENLCIISDSLHHYLNKFWFAPQLKSTEHEPYGFKKNIVLPELPSVVLDQKLINEIYNYFLIRGKLNEARRI